MVARLPLVDYLVLEPTPRLVANECTSCGARFFDHRVACASCFGQEFGKADIPTEGEVVSFTIVAFAAPGVAVPYVAAIVDCGGTRVAGNIVDTPADPEHVRLGMKVRLTTSSLGFDSAGTEAIGFGFAPAE
ncbi:MAG: OB-fold domain-containing protein [Mycobacteriales bacterium]